MAKQHTKGNGVETTNGDIPVVAPINMGKGLNWNGEIGQYEVKVAEQQPIQVNDNGELEFRVSNLEDNLLKIRDGMLYVGTKADKRLENLFVDAVNGIDQDPLKVDGAGTRAKPLRTLPYAISLKEFNTYSTIWLKEDQDHRFSASDMQYVRQGTLHIRTYGDFTDSVQATWKDWYQTNRILLEQRKEARILFSGSASPLYDGPLENFVAQRLNAIRLEPNSDLQFSGVRLVADLNFSYDRKINKSEHGSRTTIVDPTYIAVFDGTATISFDRVRFTSIGTPTVNNVLSNGEPDKGTKINDLFQKDDKGFWSVGFVYMQNGLIKLRSCLLDEAEVYLTGPSGWAMPYGSGLVLTMLNDMDHDSVVKHVSNFKFDDLGKGVKQLLTPNSNIPTKTWLKYE